MAQPESVVLTPLQSLPLNIYGIFHQQNLNVRYRCENLTGQ